MRIIIVLIIQIFLITSLDISDVFALAPSSEVILLGASVSQEGVDIKIEPQFEKSEDSSSNLVEKYLIKTQSSYFLLQDMADIKNEELIELIKNLILFFKDKDWRMPGIFKLSADVVWLYLERKPKIVGEDVFIELIKTVNQKIYLIKESMIKEEKTVIEDIFMHHIIIYLNKKMENKGKFEELLIIKIKELNKICLETEGNEVFNGFVIERISRFYTMQPEKSLDKLFQFMKQGSLEIKEKSGMKVCFVLKRYKLKESTLKKIYKVCSTLKNKDLEIMAEFILGLIQENRKMQQDNEEISEFEVYFDSFLPYKRKALVDRNKDKALKISQKREDFSNKQNLIYKIFIILEICLFIIIVLMYSTSIVVVYFCLGVAYSLIIIYGIICAWCYYFNNKLEKLDEYFIFTEHTKGFFNRIKKIDFGNNRQKQKLLADIVKYLHEQIQEYPKYTDLEKKSSKKGELLIKIKELQLLCLFILYLSAKEPILTPRQLNKIVYSDVFLIKSNPEETFINSGLFEYNFEYGDSIYAILGQIAHKTGAVIVKEGSLGKGLMLTGLFKNVISNISVLVVLDKLVAVEEEKSIQDLIKESFDESFFSFGWTLSNIHTVYLQRVKDKGDNVFSLMIIQLLSEEFFRRLYKDEDILKLLLSFLEKGSLEIKKASIDLICKLLIEYRLKQTQLELINNLEDFLFLESDEDLEDKRRFIIECLIPENSQPKRRLPTKNINVFLKEKFDFYKRSSILDRDSYKTKKQDLARRLKNQKQIEIYENQVLEHKRQRNKIYNKVKYIFIWTGIISFMVSITSIIFHMGNIVIWSCVGVAVVGIVIFFIYYIYSNWRLKKIKTLIKNFKASDRYFIFTKHTRTFFNRIKELDFSNERQKQQLLSDIVKYLNKQTKKYPTYEELERKLSKTGKLLIKIKEFHLLCLFILYLSAKESILTHEQLDKLINFDVFIDEEEYRASHVWDLGFKYSLKELEERNLIDVILGTIAHETGHSIFAEKCITYQELESRSFSEAFADISRFVVFEKLTEVRKEKTVYDLIKNCRSFIYDKVFSEYSVFNLELHWPIVVNNKSSKLSSLKKKGFIKIIKDIESGKFKIIWNKNSYKKAEFITAFGGEQGKEFYKIYLCNSYFVSAEEHYVARITLYKIMEFFNKGVVDLRYFAREILDIDCLDEDILAILSAHEIIRFDPYFPLMIDFVNLEDYRDCFCEEDFKQKILEKLSQKNVSVDNEKLNKTLKTLFKAFEFIKKGQENKPSWQNMYQEILNMIIKQEEPGTCVEFFVIMLQKIGIDFRPYIISNGGISFSGRFIEASVISTFSMSLSSDWKKIMQGRKKEYEKSQKGEPNKITDYQSKSISEVDEYLVNEDYWTSLKDVEEQQLEELFKQVGSDKDKLDLVLGLLKKKCGEAEEGSITKLFYDKIKAMPISFLKQKLMMNLAEADEETGKLIIREKAFESWETLYFEVLHEMVHFTKIDEVTEAENADKTAINREIKNYVYVMSMMKDMFGEERTEEFINALEGLQQEGEEFFEEYKVSDMKEILEEELGTMPEYLASPLETAESAQLSYPIILRKILEVVKTEESKTELMDSIYSDLVGVSSEQQASADVSNEIYAYMAIARYA